MPSCLKALWRQRLDLGTWVQIVADFVGSILLTLKYFESLFFLKPSTLQDPHWFGSLDPDTC
jgi:hypothetical protein